MEGWVDARVQLGQTHVALAPDLAQEPTNLHHRQQVEGQCGY